MVTSRVKLCFGLSVRSVGGICGTQHQLLQDQS